MNGPYVAFFLDGPLRGEYKRMEKAHYEYRVPIPTYPTVTAGASNMAQTSMVVGIYERQGSPKPRPGGWELHYKFRGVKCG